MSGIPKMPSQIQVLSGVDRAKEANRTREMKGIERRFAGEREMEKREGKTGKEAI